MQLFDISIILDISRRGYCPHSGTVQNTKMPTGNKKIYFDGNIQTFGVRSGEHDLNNIYLDFLDENGTHCYIGFMTEGTKGVVFYSGGKLIWKITV